MQTFGNGRLDCIAVLSLVNGMMEIAFKFRIGPGYVAPEWRWYRKNGGRATRSGLGRGDYKKLRRPRPTNSTLCAIEKGNPPTLT